MERQQEINKKGDIIMEYLDEISKPRKVRVTRVISGVNLQDDRTQSLVYSSKSRCFLCFVPEGQQFLLNEAELTQNCTYHDGSKIRPASIVAGRVSTVYYRPALSIPAAAM
jgi:hypothetical protein